MKLDIILSGVGGQGILSIATVIGQAALKNNLHIKQAEVHGMSQRGGDVHSNLRISSEPINSDLIARGAADVIISLEPMEALRYVPYLSENGWIVTNSAPFVNIPNYPEIDNVIGELKKLPKVILLDIDQMAKENSMLRSTNMILLGAASAVLGMDKDLLAQGVKDIFARKGQEIVDINIKALELGREAADKIINDGK